jgi:hypothetical protein
MDVSFYFLRTWIIFPSKERKQCSFSSRFRNALKFFLSDLIQIQIQIQKQILPTLHLCIMAVASQLWEVKAGFFLNLKKDTTHIALFVPTKKAWPVAYDTRCATYIGVVAASRWEFLQNPRSTQSFHCTVCLSKCHVSLQHDRQPKASEIQSPSTICTVQRGAGAGLSISKLPAPASSSLPGFSFCFWGRHHKNH